MRLVCLLLMAVFTATAAAQEKPRKKSSPKKQQIAHKKPTPDQLRKFKDLEKKQKR